MTITLIDGGKIFQDLEIKEHGNSKTVHCLTGLPFTSISRYLICKDGRVYGRIATELVAAGVYDCIVYHINNESSLAKMLQYHIKELQNG